ncbi:hypothetical protein NDU88_002978 [Pleurodeles waltl]|uniref:Uncharacterized protein n=1 Tax=Pleurodeles waltl TaxID=8319 RepID=A0AAV7TN67_PLEWA|nr:hypothetical protein NDU88_002978 [Pleurodeles waltl]
MIAHMRAEALQRGKDWLHAKMEDTGEASRAQDLEATALSNLADDAGAAERISPPPQKANKRQSNGVRVRSLKDIQLQEIGNEDRLFLPNVESFLGSAALTYTTLRAKTLEEIEQLTKEILTFTTPENFEEVKVNLDKKLIKYEEDITAKKQRTFLRDFKDYQAGRILTFHRKYDHMFSNEYRESLPDMRKDTTGTEVHESEESDMSDSNYSDTTDTSSSSRTMGSDKNIERANFLKQFRLLNQGRTDQKKD